MTTDNQDQLEDQQLSALYKHAQQDMPPAHLDKAILTAAKEKASPRPFNPFTYNWRVPASLAAVLVISFGVVTLVDNDFAPVNGDTTSVFEVDEMPQQLSLPEASSLSDQTLAIKEAPLLRKKSAELEKVIDQQGLVAEQKISNKSKQVLSRKPAQRSIPDKEEMQVSAAPAMLASPTAQLADKIVLANRTADELIKKYFGSDLDKLDPAQIEMPIEEWKTLIIELRKLAREEEASKLEALLEKRLAR